ncbi:hypothetical protein AMTR_s00200p00019060 [Amborella trichopoda]|uniref:Aminotransferase-like plant mobile domain-containing protein n=1 Tax=Amborella trichopoda TaxID=13333 RepID=W1NS16_AMBTC|nr:hypothetical protein AMTR_s00200p00019060 [Amborella trichopoda]
MEDIQEILRTLEKEEIRIDEKSYQLNEWKLTREQVQLVHAFGLGPLAIIRPGRIDHPLVAANIERWCFETNTFHFNIHIGEMTPILFDVYEILELTVDGDPVTCRPIKDLRKFIEDNLGIVPDVNLASLRHTCLTANFRELPPDTTPVQVPTHMLRMLQPLHSSIAHLEKLALSSEDILVCWSYEQIMHMRPIPHSIPPNIPRAKRWEPLKKYHDNPHNLMPPIRQEIDNLQPNKDSV